MIENLQKIQTYQIKSKPIVGSVVFCLSFFFSHWLRLQSPRIGLNWIFWARRRVSPLTLRLLASSSAVSVFLAGGSAPGPGPRVCSGPVRSGGSDAGELVPQAGRQDALHLLHDEVQRSEQRAEELPGDTETQKTLKSLLLQFVSSFKGPMF